MYDVRVKSKGLISHGVSACAGCGLELIIRKVLEVLGEDTVIVIPPGCSALFCGFGIEGNMKIGGFQGNLENTAAIAAGIKAGLSVQGNTHTTVLGFAGDGATLDIGLQALSGTIERGDKILYICYDNEAYMNTGIQGSSSTPYGASTTTTPTGKRTSRKDLLQIAIAHDIPYAASASIANIPDLQKKVKKAKEADGTALLHIHCSCPTGWGFPPAKSIEVCRNAVQSGAWLLYEYENGKMNMTYKPKELKPVENYLKSQKRFRSLSPEQVQKIQDSINKKYQAMTSSDK